MNLFNKIEKLEKDAEAFGLRWENTSQIIEQIRSECDEIVEHISQPPESIKQAELQEEIGDLIHAAFSLCVFCKLSPQETLENTLKKFEGRLKGVKKITHELGMKNLDGHSFEELMRIWEKAKAVE